MAERRMFAKSIIDSDMFLDMPVTAQLLYFQLGMRADDDGFVNNPKRIMRDVRCSDDDMKVLIAKRYIIPFESGVIVIRHWKLHNFIRRDRYKPSTCEEKNMIETTKDKVYELSESNGMPLGIPNDNQTVTAWDTQVRLGKDSIGKDRVVVVDEEEPSPQEEELGEVVRTYENNIHLIGGGIERDTLLSLFDKYGKKWMLKAIEEAVLCNVRNIKYIRAILKNWKELNVKEPWNVPKKNTKETSQTDNRPDIPYVSDLMARDKEMYP